ncbi:MAG: winged helix DNA-binding domain-containing protein [Rubrobacteraceae bacterium]
MTDSNIARRRLANQLLARPESGLPGEVVRWFGAVQAQDYAGSLWAIGVRVLGATGAGVERAIAERRIVRTWPMRGTIHLVPAEDARWMLDLMTPRIIAGSVKRHRDLDLDEKAFESAREEIQEILEGGKVVTRPDLMRHLDSRGISTSGQRGYHILSHLAQTGFLCLGPREGKQPTVVLLDEWVPESRSLTREESLAEIATRYFRSHGPATLHDFVWWTGLTVADCRAAMDGISSQLEEWRDGDRTLWHMPTGDEPEGEPERVMLLPFVDEYMVGYRDRSDFLKPEHTERTFHGLMSVVISDGEIVGMWKRKLASKKVAVELDLFRDLDGDERQSLNNVLRRYGEFLGKDAELSRA